MISLKRNSKGELVEATGYRSRNIYDPMQTGKFRLSRSKFSDFLQCRRCFYLDRVCGLTSPGLPSWSLNQATDDLLKREFDQNRMTKTPHRMFEKFGLTNVIPYQHQDMDKWRDATHHGLEFDYPGSNLTLTGGIDDLWFDQNTEEVIVVDYKSQANNIPVQAEAYLETWHHQGYKTQLDFYAYLLHNMGYQVAPYGYFYVCNADKSATGFHGKLLFEEVLVPYKWNIDWISSHIDLLLDVLKADVLPESNPSCENCAYAYQRNRLEIK
ncbi:MAG: hypothetical protein CL776_00945 [Chloroflexi bacterium]|nr:hypothetical protein [Chloroflexota bacterium]|tara:strand:- start:267 stop:1073 length:807 start_codon:yes stop_codon:yes gene_type:complete